MPIAIDVYNKKVLLIGGGRIAMHKIDSLKNYAKNIHIVAKEVCDEIKASGFTYEEKEYEINDLYGAVLVYACTNIKELNKKVKDDAATLNILTNVVDNPAVCDFVSPAIYRNKHISIAVSSNGENVHKSIAVRNVIKDFFENDNLHKI